MLDNPLQGLKELLEEEPQHPYSLMAEGNFKRLIRLLAETLEAFKKASRNLNLPYHSILVMNEDFYETFEIKAFIRGYSGAIINLTSGTTLSKAGV